MQDTLLLDHCLGSARHITRTSRQDNASQHNGNHEAPAEGSSSSLLLPPPPRG